MEERRKVWSNVSPLEDYLFTQHPSSFYKQHQHGHEEEFHPDQRIPLEAHWEYPTANWAPIQHAQIYPLLPQEPPPPPPPLNIASRGRGYAREPFIFLNIDHTTRGSVPLGFEPPPSPPFSASMRDAGPSINRHMQEGVYSADSDDMSIEEEEIKETEGESVAGIMDDAETVMNDQEIPGLGTYDLEDCGGEDRPLYKTVKTLLDDVEELKLNMQRDRHQFLRLCGEVDEMVQQLRNQSQRPWRYGFGGHGMPYQVNREYTHPESRSSADNTPLKTTKPIEEYNATWKAVFETKERPGSRLTIPWPTTSLQVNMLSQRPQQSRRGFQRRSHLPKQISDDIFQLRKWNAFSFFVKAFGLHPKYMLVDSSRMDVEAHEEPREGMVFDIRAQGASRGKLNALKAQLVQEKLRWHPDRMKRLSVGFSAEEEEAAKAVLSAVLDSSKACNGCLDGSVR
ncbi:hypothetical protein FQN49_000421 [Arthroderma sp. PD_2]|nr:hypothetical protein FQN49_000421 [Arthroderma sp. PD_2]